ncbi:MAG: hypothetical protein ACHQ49_09935 [Elusimicrobiota bacterium]
MRKIKGFKLVLRPHEVRRRARRAGLDLDGAGLTEPVLNKTLERLAKHVVPGVLFDTFGHPDPDRPILSPLPGLAYSLILASLGDDPFPAALREKEAAVPAALWPLLVETALEECVRFASNIIADEAEKDNCELSPITPVSEASALAAALRKLDAAKLGVALDGVRLVPAACLAVSLSWLAKSKAKGRK